jgi:DNA invertase Pin-like site-specific DNA recombinase
MFIRVSTREQDAKRAKNELIAFAQEHKHKVTTFLYRK